MLIKITEPKFTIVFRTEDVVRITPVFVDREVDYYYLQLSKTSKGLRLSIDQARQLIPLLLAVDLSIELDEETTDLLEKPEENFDKIMSDLLDMAIDQDKRTRSSKENRTVRSGKDWIKVSE